jgi:diguanylate cyclase (GGDEF)-like protein
MLIKLIALDYRELVQNSIMSHINGITDEIDVQFKMRLVKDKSVWISIRGRALYDEHGKALRVAGSISNINKEKIAEEQVIQLAYYDPLTKLPNRQLFEKELSEVINNKLIKSFSLMFIDIDNLKAINDSLGYRQGDIVIKNVTEILNKHIGLKQDLYKFGGDEFIIITRDIETIEEIEVYLRELLKEFQKPFDIEGLGFTITLSIGVALYPIDGDCMDLLLKHADTALNHIKQKGKNGYEIFSYEMNENLNERLMMERDLRRAVAGKELELYYQPKVDIISKTIVGYEALLRWNHKEKGLIMPLEFIPLAEETGLIIPIGEWVIAEAVNQLRKWHIEGHAELTISINLSAKQLKDIRLIEFFTNIIKSSGIDPRHLEVEITETTALYDINYAITILTELKTLGIKVSLDDFGTGYSSLNYLTVLPIDTLKIDKTFLDKNNEKQNTEIIKSVIALAHACDMNVVAEGVETQEQLDFLAEEDCDLMQGFYFSKPLPYADAIKLRPIVKK